MYTETNTNAQTDHKSKTTHLSVLLHHHFRRGAQDHVEVQDASDGAVGHGGSKLESHVWTQSRRGHVCLWCVQLCVLCLCVVRTKCFGTLRAETGAEMTDRHKCAVGACVKVLLPGKGTFTPGRKMCLTYWNINGALAQLFVWRVCRCSIMCAFVSMHFILWSRLILVTINKFHKMGSV